MVATRNQRPIATTASSRAGRQLQIPTGFWPKAQGWRASAYLGTSSHKCFEPQRGYGHTTEVPHRSDPEQKPGKQDSLLG